MTVTTAHAVEAAQTVVSVAEIAAVLAEMDRLRIALADELEAGRQADAQVAMTVMRSW